MITPQRVTARRFVSKNRKLTVLGFMPIVASLLLTPALVFVSPAFAAGDANQGACPNEAVRERETYGRHLPDCRAYEQVTPTAKDATNPSGGDGLVQAALTGDAVTFLVLADMPGASGSAEFPIFIARRGSADWTSAGLDPPVPPGRSEEVMGSSEDLAKTLVFGYTPLEGLYLRNNATGEFDLAVPGLHFQYFLDGFSASSRQFTFETTAQLLPEATPGLINLYEWDEGHITLVGLLPESEGGGVPPGGSFGGPYNWVSDNVNTGGASSGYYTTHTLSRDADRSYFTAGSTGQLYVRMDKSHTVRVSAEQRTIPDTNGPRPAAFMAASADGNEVYFLSCEKLTDDATATSTSSASCAEKDQGQDLYRFTANSGQLADLTPDVNTGDPLGAAVQGVLGTGDSAEGGSYVYFTANGVLAPGASPGACEGFQVISFGACNLYVWHQGEIRYVSRLASGEDRKNWSPEPTNSGENVSKSSRVTPDGRVLLFSSNQRLTFYDNHGLAELYRFDAGKAVSPDNPSCVSCIPSGAAPSARVNLRSIHTTLGVGAGTSLTRNMSADGARVYFETPDSLVQADTDSKLDVYEWESVGTGTCQSGEEAAPVDPGGCIYLISSGRSATDSYFGDASESGADVFLFTDQTLVGQDQDQLVDIYDARQDGGLVDQNTSPTEPCFGEECHPGAISAPQFGVQPSATYAGPGNLVPSVLSSGGTKKSIGVAEMKRKALAACKRKRSRRARTACEMQVRKRYRTQAKSKSRPTPPLKGSPK